MMRTGKNIFKSYMTLEYKFTGNRIQDSCIIPVNWDLSVNLVVSDKKLKTKEEIENKVAIAYQKIHFWLDANLPNCIMVDVDKEEDMYIASLTSNTTVFCPGNPGDDLIIQLIHSKISALAQDIFVIGEMSLKNTDMSLKYVFDVTENSYNLPETTAEYYSHGVARDELPWWSRDDGFCFEFIKPDGSELSEEELFGDIVDPMDEFFQFMAELSLNNAVDITKEPARIVQVEKWKPKTV